MESFIQSHHNQRSICLFLRLFHAGLQHPFSSSSHHVAKAFGLRNKMCALSEWEGFASGGEDLTAQMFWLSIVDTFSMSPSESEDNGVWRRQLLLSPQALIFMLPSSPLQERIASSDLVCSAVGGLPFFETGDLDGQLHLTLEDSLQ